VRYPSAVNRNSNLKWAYGLLSLAVAYLAAVYVVPSFAQSDGKASSGQCAYRKVSLEHGEHNGRPWRITASIEKNGSCSSWLLKAIFSPQGVGPGSWTGGWGVPAGGHLPRSATIGARDDEEEDGRAVSGVVGSRVRSVVLKLNDGGMMVVHPKDPSEALRRHFVWLRNLRYFLRFYPAGEHVKAARLLDADGKIIFTARSEEGSLRGFMGY
jgi:hypothetical protein